MARAFRIYAKEQEKEIVEYIETHTTSESEAKFGYSWFTIKPWYDEHKGNDPLSLYETTHYDNASPAQKVVSAIFAHYDKLQVEIVELKNQLAEAHRELKYLQEFRKHKERAEWEPFREVYEYCQG